MAGLLKKDLIFCGFPYRDITIYYLYIARTTKARARACKRFIHLVLYCVICVLGMAAGEYSMPGYLVLSSPWCMYCEYWPGVIA